MNAKWVLIVANPIKILAFSFDYNRNCIGVPPGTTDIYLGHSMMYVYLAMTSVMRYERSSNSDLSGYPIIRTYSFALMEDHDLGTLNEEEQLAERQAREGWPAEANT